MPYIAYLYNHALFDCLIVFSCARFALIKGIEFLVFLYIYTGRLPGQRLFSLSGSLLLSTLCTIDSFCQKYHHVENK